MVSPALQGARKFPVAGTRLYKSTREKQSEQIEAWLWCISVEYWYGYPFMQGCQVKQSRMSEILPSHGHNGATSCNQLYNL